MSLETDRTRVLLADDHDVVRNGLRLLLEQNFPFEVVEVATARDAVAWAGDESIGLILLDVRLGEPDGLWALGQIRKKRPDVPIIMLSTFDDDRYVQQAIEGGANGYLLKEASLTQLREAVETGLGRRGLYLHPSVAHRMVFRQRNGPSPTTLLSDRELEVLRLVAEGRTNDEISIELHVTEKTVKSHLSNIFRKLEVTNRTQAAAKALRERLVRPPD